MATKYNARILRVDLTKRKTNAEDLDEEVTKKYVGDGEHCVECDIWVENPRAEKTVVGTAIVTMPARTALCYQHVSAPKHLKSD